MRNEYLFSANLIFVVHFLLVLVVAFGWLIPGKFFYVFLTFFVLTFISEIAFGYCALTKIEFDLRRRIDPDKKFDKSCIAHYIRSWRGLPPRESFITQKTFLQNNSFIILMLGLLLVSLLWRIFVY
ncbi:MAG: DUF2784 family protein [Candidatus Paceibacterota bacterium]